VYQKQGEDWIQTAKLVPNDAIAQLFGASVSIDYPYAVVGAPGHSIFSGCVYVFFHNGTSWTQVNKFFKPVGAGSLNYFGNSVDIDGNYIVVGCPGADETISNGGSVFTYRLNAGTWSLHQTLALGGILTLSTDAVMGTAVSIAQDRIVVGIPGQPAAGSFSSKGRVVVFSLSGSTWAPESLIFSPVNPSFTSSEFGSALDIHYTAGATYLYTIAIGAPGSYMDFASAPDIENIGQVVVYRSNNGMAAYVPVVVNGVLPEQHRNPVPAKGYRYGASVSIYHTAGAASFPGTEIFVQVGIPGMNGNRGAIENLYFFNGPDASDGAIIPSSFTMQRQGTTQGSSANEKWGFSLSLYDPTTFMSGTPGVNADKGAVRFN
jgi:hypothetical protein